MRRVLFALLAMSCFHIGFAQEQESSQTKEFSRWKVRVRGIGVVPNESATIGIIGGDANISNALVPELDFTYYFTKNIAAELIFRYHQARRTHRRFGYFRHWRSD